MSFPTIRIVSLAGLLIVCSAFAVQPSGIVLEKLQYKQDTKKSAGRAAAAPMEVRFIDDSTLKVVMRDPAIELQTPYGKLIIPLRDIERIELGRRISEDLARQIDEAANKLGSPQFREREEAGNLLLALGQRAYPALVWASKSPDLEVSRRVERILEQLREKFPAELLEMPDYDVIHTSHSKIAGQIVAPSLKVTTFQFGNLELKLADAHSLRRPGIGDSESVANKNVLPDPGSLVNHQNQIGKTFLFRVTGAVNGSLWGTGTYTTDSSLAMAAVHAGVLKLGQSGVVKFKIVASPPAFQGSAKNGINSMPYGPFGAAFEVSRGHGGAQDR